MFFTFPVKNSKLLQVWLKNIGRQGFMPSFSSIICSDHIEENSYSTCRFTKRRLLKQEVVPIIFSKTPKQTPKVGLPSSATDGNNMQPDGTKQNIMVVSCCAFGCTERAVKGGPVTFHCFPKDEERRKIWEIKIRRENFKATKSSRLCSKHFSPDSFDREKFGGTWLKKTAVPTVFNFDKHVVERKITRKPLVRKTPEPEPVIEQDGVQYTHRKLSLPDDSEDWNPWGEEFEREKNLYMVQKKISPIKVLLTNQSLDVKKQFSKHIKNDASQSTYVEIWGKAAIGLYVWEHILGGKLESKMDGIWNYGFKRIDNLKLKFRTGPGVITTKAPSDVQNLILILNGRSDDKVSFATMWLDFLPQFHNLRFVILIILGNEQCHNEWLIPYMSKSGGLVNKTFIVYDSPLVDNDHIYQWPLGVATYRGFPKVDPKKLDLENLRPYVCNFLGSIYPHSSREKLLNVIESNNLTQFCFIKARYEWQPKETKQTLSAYIQSLHLSDLTLSPVGMNTECYRIYEAMAFGSVPVVEDVMTPGICDDSKVLSASAPLRLLKSYNAPIIYIKDWVELPDLISQELRMPLEDKIKRRIKIVQWYENFKIHLRENLLSVLKENILRKER
ncbi:Ribitol-5-phosphate xylosyltransferase 1 [Araneus ventricosus]|uniref:Ribitol-5-phosphate xylosyltransferase 1 n=1 Tax=Araneus ventricosus TaxID=182803 RepID=A0A4Y2A0X5_ARAVE|nr:Ribitol-5-phosphate xylosyltransferase 1 [Araneus ventricosus]